MKTAIGSGGQSTENLGYLYDAAWNLNKRTNNSAVSTFAVNSKNELTSEPGYTDSFDYNGNLTARSDGGYNTAYSYTYDDENELTSVAYQSSYAASSAWWRSDFTYDGLGRRRKQVDYTWLDGYGWYQGGETRFVYDGRRVIQERNSGNTPTVAYTRGNDLSGSFEGAGGIGGLLGRSHGYSGGNWRTHHFYHADANGNITALIDGSQALSATYKYDPFGKQLSSSGSMASATPFEPPQ